MDDVRKIPIRTLLFAMRISSKYGMEDIKMAITGVITNMISPAIEIRQEIERLAFMTEFPTYFSVSVAGDTFDRACSSWSSPSANDLKPLLVHPGLIAAMMRNRESRIGGQSKPPQLAGWLLEEINSFGFSR